MTKQTTIVVIGALRVKNMLLVLIRSASGSKRNKYRQYLAKKKKKKGGKMPDGIMEGFFRKIKPKGKPRTMSNARQLA